MWVVAAATQASSTVGSSAVSRAAANDATLSPVILYPIWTSLRDEMAYKAGNGNRFAAAAALLGFKLSGCDVDDVNPTQDMKRIAARPVLFVSGSEDQDTPPRIMDRMFALSSAPKELWRVPGVGHGGYEEAQPAEFERRVVGFLDRYFRR